MSANTLIAVTPGEPAGIGIDICLMLALKNLSAIPVAIADPELLQQRAELLKLNVNILPLDTTRRPSQHIPGTLHVSANRLAETSIAGKLNTANANYVLNTLQQAVAGCQNSTFHALVTGPIHKGNIIQSGHDFSGHTEYLGQLTKSFPVMMLATAKMRVALLTTHIPLAHVSSALTYERLYRTIQILHQDLIRLFAIKEPRICVTGLNPHAGEQGHLGNEEINVIEPVIAKLQTEGVRLHGPVPADTAFTSKQLSQCDVVLTMFHDQGLPVIKHAGFGECVNITLGLPIIRTSVDHGTALDLAGTGKADADSLYTAFELAAQLRN